MSLDSFHEQLNRAIEEAGQLSQRAVEPDRHASDILLETLQELQSALEELQVAEEELHRQQEELELSRAAAEIARARYQTLFDFAPDAYIVTDRHGLIREGNRAAGRLLGMEPERLAGKALASFIPVPDRRAFRAALSGGVRNPGVRAADLRVGPLRGRPVDVSATIEAGEEPAAGTSSSADTNATAATEATNGGAQVVRWSLHEVTERRRLERELRTINAQLEERVRARTADLDAASRAKDEFLAMLGHELRNPLAPVRNAVELLRQLDLEPKAQNLAEILDRQTAHMARMVDDLLDISRITRGHIELQRAGSPLPRSWNTPSRPRASSTRRAATPSTWRSRPSPSRSRATGSASYRSSRTC